jgi:hypothetical protein
MSIKDKLHAAIDSLSEEEAASILLVLQRERDDRQATARAAMRDSMRASETLADDE